MINRNDSDVHLLIGTYYAYLGEKDSARASLDIALRERPGDAHYLTFAAIANTVMGNSQEALTQLEKAHARGLASWEVQTEPELDALPHGKLETIFQ
jgi:Flp pilus assembly protein TadD